MFVYEDYLAVLPRRGHLLLLLPNVNPVQIGRLLFLLFLGVLHIPLDMAFPPI
jgi:hypothetical protein